MPQQSLPTKKGWQEHQTLADFVPAGPGWMSLGGGGGCLIKVGTESGNSIFDCSVYPWFVAQLGHEESWSKCSGGLVSSGILPMPHLPWWHPGCTTGSVFWSAADFREQVDKCKCLRWTALQIPHPLFGIGLGNSLWLCRWVLLAAPPPPFPFSASAWIACLGTAVLWSNSYILPLWLRLIGHGPSPLIDFRLNGTEIIAVGSSFTSCLHLAWSLRVLTVV